MSTIGEPQPVPLNTPETDQPLVPPFGTEGRGWAPRAPCILPRFTLRFFSPLILDRGQALEAPRETFELQGEPLV